MVAHICEYTKNHRVVHLKQVNYMVYELYLSKAVDSQLRYVAMFGPLNTPPPRMNLASQLFRPPLLPLMYTLRTGPPQREPARGKHGSNSSPEPTTQRSPCTSRWGGCHESGEKLLRSVWSQRPLREP